ncbi:MAG TPA: MscL family protein [Solirubrobacteraceae bacterium]|jgi:large conductance mechanosensitive channel|nr:MscL family protein [Solirubrobacteraceae bacterium]
MLRDFRKFLIDGDLVTAAVGLVMALVLAALVKALVADLLTPLIAAIVGKPSFGALSFTINGSHFLYGDFINNLITFVSTGAAVFFVIVRPYNRFKEHIRREPDADSDTRPCSECLSDIPKRAARCAHCAAPQTPLAD